MNKFVLIGCMFACFALTASASIQCDGCKTIVSLIEGWAKEGKTHDEILQLVINICGLLGVNYKDVCTMGVDGWLETILADLTVKTPEQVCISTLHLCENATAVTAVKDDLKCSGCKVVIDGLKGFITDSTTEQAIINFLDGICALLPNQESVCDQVIAFGVLEVAELIKANVATEEICQKIGLCA